MLETLRRALAGQLEPFPSDSKKARAAVGVLIKQEGDDLWLLMIKRHENPRDPWSGQMAFPGGHADLQDRTLFDTVAREALEEVGIDIRKQEFLGCLTNLQPKNAPMIVTPFVFLLSQEVHPKTSPEAKEVIWIPISFLSDSRNISSMTFTIDDRSVTMGCYTYSGHVIWGVSFRIVRDIIELLTRDRQDI
jgi:8-oxo-dGTP pyrophosphatase MutT (NUDIX family)